MRNGNGDTAFFASRRAERNNAVRAECGNGKFIALLCEDRTDNVADIRILIVVNAWSVFGIRPRIRILYFNKSIDSFIHSRNVHVNNFFAFFAVSFADGVLQEADSFFKRKNIGKFEISGLCHHVDTSAKTDFLRNFHGVDIIEFEFLLRDNSLHLTRKFFFKFFNGIPCGVQKESSAFFNAFENII